MKVIVVGSRGQDGTLLTGLLRDEGHQVYGVHSEGVDADSWAPALSVSLYDTSSIERLHAAVSFDEAYYLAALHGASQDQISDDTDLLCRSTQINLTAFHALLESVRRHSPKTRVFYACSSHIFAESEKAPQDEETPFAPNSIYGITKLSGHLIARMYRRKYGVFVTSGILYNHESHLRPERFLSSKIVRNALQIRENGHGQIEVGNLDGVVDWGHALDYVRAMRRSLSLAAPGEFVIATGVGRTVRDFVDTVFSELDMDWRDHTRVNESVAGERRRPLVGDPSRITAAGWERQYTFSSMIKDLILKAQSASRSSPGEVR